MKTSEHEHQKTLFKWAGLNAKSHPELSLMFAIPNGGQRHMLVAAKLKAEGVKAGVPDICLPVPNEKYHSLYIELKAEKGRTSKIQDEWLSALQEQGHKAVVCHGWDAARQAIESYLSIGK